MSSLFNWISDSLISRLEKQTRGYRPYTPSDIDTLRSSLQPCDIILVEGDQKISSAIKYLTQSTWSHAALYIGPDKIGRDENGYDNCLIEAEIRPGVIASPLEKFASFNTRICRPVDLTPEDQEKIIDFAVNSIGKKYDVSNIVDLARFLIPTPPMPVRFRRSWLSMGSGDPTRAICSTLIAQAFQSVRYPILPNIIEVEGHARSTSQYSRKEILQIRHHSLYTPRDFDVSPYFRIIKPTLTSAFDYRQLTWDTDLEEEWIEQHPIT